VRGGTPYCAPRGCPFPSSNPIHDDSQSCTTRAHRGFIVNWAAVLGAGTATVLNAVESGRSVPVEDVDARGHRSVAAKGLAFPARAQRVKEGGYKEATVAGEAEIFQVWIQRLACISCM